MDTEGMVSGVAENGDCYFEARKYEQIIDFKAYLWMFLGSFVGGVGQAAWREWPLTTTGPLITPVRIGAFCSFLGLLAFCYVSCRVMLRARLILDDEGIWEQGVFSPLRCMVRWEDISEVRASGFGRRGHWYFPSDMVIRHTGRPRGWHYDFWWSAFDRSIPVLRMVREMVPAGCVFDEELEKVLREAEEVE
ncbi:MAG: hypothetical protein RBU21_03750 [FCB group bacterium]|jgi:hypothetical protein|nr:hypothetical protein [FCB group bacterium]